MEFDPSMRGRPLYREIVAKNPTGPKCVLGLNFGQPHVQPLVQKLYRLKLLKDLMIRPLLDDVGAAAMNNMINSVQTSICNDVCPHSPSIYNSEFRSLVIQTILDDSCKKLTQARV